METKLDKYKKDLSKLLATSNRIELDLILRAVEEKQGQLEKKEKELKKRVGGSLEKHYQQWYTQGYWVIRDILPERLDEFEILYKGEAKRRKIDGATYTIQDWLNGVRSEKNQYTGQKYFNDFAAVSMRFNTQLAILKSAILQFESSLYNISQLLLADLFDSELDAARELVKNGFLRGGGAIAAVVLEKHLADVCKNHKLATRKKNPSISDYNDLLKENSVIDIPTWRFIQRLADLRNICVHKKDREPTKEEVDELIAAADKVCKTMF